MPKGTKVLMVDDDKMLLDMYKERLELAGFKVESSTNGEECLAKIHQVKPDIILLDIMMPKVNGYDTLASIKSDPATKDIPVIMLSALVRDINKSRAIEAGADDYIIKSEVMPADVIKKIENVLSKYNKDVTTLPQKDNPPSNPSPQAPPSVTPPMAPPKGVPSGPTNSQEIQFEPSKPQTTQKPQPSPKTFFSSPFFLVLIILLILAGGLILYLRYLARG